MTLVTEARPRTAAKPLSSRKQTILDTANRYAPERKRWRSKASFFHAEDESYLTFLIPKGQRILDIGCGTGDTLARLEPEYGVGLDISPRMIEIAQRAHPDLLFHAGDVEDDEVLAGISGTFDSILISDTMGVLDDCQALLEKLHRFCHRESRVIISYYSHLWQPLLNFAEIIGWRSRQPLQSVLSPADIRDLASLADFETIKSIRRLLSPFRLAGLGRLINRFLSPLPGLRLLTFRHYTICRSTRHAISTVSSASVVIPARNERGNIEQAILRMPSFCDDIEIVFVEGHSVDGTFEEMERVQAAYPQYDIRIMRQPGRGKADAVFTAFDAARGDVLMILDADLTMPPEQLCKFWKAIASGKAEFANGSRLTYPLDEEAMRFLNFIANKLFSLLFTWLLSQRFTDTLCGTKVLRRNDYLRLKAGRDYFGDFDPFGDFELIFGASKLNLKCLDIPIRYAARTYGETQISRFRHGLMLLRMVIFAFFKVKAL